MPIRVLVVDDSGFFRRRVTEIINADPRLEVIGTASNGLEAIDQNEALQPDIITLDYEMPAMDGITALRNIMNRRPVPVLMFSSLTFEGARVTLDALDAGAVDFLPKNFDAVAKGTKEMRELLADKIIAVAKSGQAEETTEPNQPSIETESAGVGNLEVFAPEAPGEATQLSDIKVVIMGTSTGGPAALQLLFKALPQTLPFAILIIQHMPASFTSAFAERLNKVSPLSVSEAKDGDALKAGQVLVAPGGMQLMLDNRGGACVRIRESDERINYRPSVDIALASAAKHFGKQALGIVMTGMGNDGKEGARLLKSAGGHIWTQDEASCVIYGMPAAVVAAGYSDATVKLKDLSEQLTHIQ
jgi:two-component system chemotaxis response regulator CheB